MSYGDVLDGIATALALPAPADVAGVGVAPTAIAADAPTTGAPAPASAGFGLAVASLDGEVSGIGRWREQFSIQSVSKVFALAAVVARDDDSQAIWSRVGREPSGDPFNSLVQLERARGVPRNPFINAGAIVVTDHLLTLTGDACAAVVELLRRESGAAEIDPDPDVVAAEVASGHRNAALAHLIADFGNLHNDVDTVLDHYFRACALQLSCAELALAGGFLARHGLRRDGGRIMSRSDAKRINAVMLTCGTYDAAGEFAYRVGLPAKSGVGGGILAVVPGRCTVCAWSPELDAAGNPILAATALEAFTTLTGWSVF